MELPVTVSGTIIHGKHLATTFGMPTANIDPSEDVTGLAHGVYYSVITVGGKEYPAITNLGIRPTVSDDGRVNAETFIYGYTGDLYGQQATVRLCSFRRAEKKFASDDELFFAISDDIREGAAFHHLPASSLPAALTSSSIASV